MSAQRIQTAMVIILLLAVVVGAVTGFLLRWNATLEKKEKQRTGELERSNTHLKPSRIAARTTA